MTKTLQELIENFALFDDWEERYRYLIDIGRALPHLDEALRTEENLVRGCTSQVWMIANVQDNVLHLQADSDAHIVRGLVAILMAAYNETSIEDVRNIDISAAFQEIGLDQHLSANRRSGFTAMVEKIKRYLAE